MTAAPLARHKRNVQRYVYSPLPAAGTFYPLKHFSIYYPQQAKFLMPTLTKMFRQFTTREGNKFTISTTPYVTFISHFS